jgi:hypothetical protein
LQFEKALSYLATLACLYRERGRSFSFYSGEYETDLNGSKESFKGLLEYLAWVQPTNEQTIDLKKIKEGSIVFTAGPNPEFEDFSQIDYMEL